MRRKLILYFTLASLVFAAVQVHVFSYHRCCVETEDIQEVDNYGAGVSIMDS